MMILVAVLLWTFSGYIILGKGTDIQSNSLKGLLAFLFGISCVSFFFICSLFSGFSFNAYQLIMLLIPLICLIVVRKDIYENFRRHKPAAASSSNLLIAIIFTCICIYTQFFLKVSMRWGDYDAWAIWILHAKFLTYGNDFINCFKTYHHADYPLMLPGIVAIMWKSLSSTSAVIPVIVDYVICMSMILIIVSSFFEKKIKTIGHLCVGTIDMHKDFISDWKYFSVCRCFPEFIYPHSFYIVKSFV